ncbi:family 2 encapsulin nanocompartment cargo protein terpene cyclase [Streptomyces sp. NPDC051109]|uniref:family 2 encapsulin nanocompartment cargo protein terpene cyclase n=1 Tax=Streptomyces sp. NPDC051109 TaxID=3365642 RepID=UPI0010D9FEC3
MQKHPPAAYPDHPPHLPDPSDLSRAPDPSVPPAPPVPSRAALLARLRGGPGGPGTSTLRVRPALPAPAAVPAPSPAPVPAAPSAAPSAGPSAAPAAPGASRGNPAVPELYCPPPQRDDPALAEAVEDRLIAWAEETGIYAGRPADVRALSMGRYTMLTYAHVEDPDRLLAPAKCTLAQWATDDYYCDDESAGAVPLRIATHLSQALAAIDPAHLPAAYAPLLERAMCADPVLVALRSSTEHLSRYATRSQLTRYRHEMAALFSGYTAEAGWRVSGRTPPVWEFLSVRQDNSFIPTMVMLDPAGGYELPVEAYADPRVRGAVLKAASASVIVNDLYSMHREDESAAVNYNLPALIEAEEGCSRAEAVRRSADLHDELVHAFEEESALLAAAGFPPLVRFLADVWAWLGGNLEWHRTTARYHRAGPATALDGTRTPGPTHGGTTA